MDTNEKGVRGGFGLIEAVIAASVISLTLVGVIAAFRLYVRVGTSAIDQTKAAFLAEEGAEAARFIRDNAWSNISSPSSDALYYLYFEGSSWTVTTTPSVVDGVFVRSILFSDVYRRNVDSDIVSLSSADPKVFDPDTRQITISVSGGTLSTTTTIRTYVTNLFAE